MIDKTPIEQEALEAALRPLGEIAAEIGMAKPLADYTREEVLTLVETVVSAWQHYLLENSRIQSPNQPKEEGVPYMPLDLDFNHRSPGKSATGAPATGSPATLASTSTVGTGTSDTINSLIDAALQNKSAQEPPRDYLGASRLGVSCSRALQYEYTRTPRDKAPSGKLLRTFEMGHVLEGMALSWLRGAGFEIATHQPDSNPTRRVCRESPLDFGFSTAGGRIQGHVDGIIQAAPAAVGIRCPSLWECKSMNAKSWKQTVDKGVRAAKPVYAVQIALYQAYMEASVPGISQNPALFTAVNKDTSEIYHELVAFDAAIAQEASDRGVNILRATQAGEILPRISMDPEYFECRFCDWKTRCWTGSPGTDEPGIDASGKETL